MPDRFLNHQTLMTGRIGGFFVVASSAVGQWVVEHGISDAMLWIAIMGFALQAFTSIPAILKSLDAIREHRNKGKR